MTILQGKTVDFDVSNFGVIWDGIHDDYPGLMLALAQVPLGASARLILPYGMGYCSQTPRIARGIQLVGRAGGISGVGSGWRTPPGVTCLICDDSTYSVDGGDSHHALIENLDLQSTLLINSSAFDVVEGGTAFTVHKQYRSANTFYEKGSVVLADGNANPTRFFRADNGGTTGAGTTDPGGWAVAVPGEPFEDNEIKWICEAFPQDWVASSTTLVGDRVWGFPGDNRYYFEAVTIAGTGIKGSTMPAMFGSPLINGAFIADGQVEWMLRIHAGVWMKAPVHLKRLNISGVTGCAVHIHGDIAQQGNDCSFAKVDRLQAYYCGEGILFRGLDCNGGSSESTTTVNLGWQRPSSGLGPWDRTTAEYPSQFGGRTIWDASLGGNTHHNAYAQDGGSAYVSEDGTRAVFVACRSENGCSDFIGAAGLYVGSVGGFFHPPLGTGVILDPQNGRGIREVTASGATKLWSGLSFTGGVLPMSTALDQNDAGWWYENIDGNPVGTGWYALAYGPYSAGNPHAFLGVSMYAARNTGSGVGPGIFIGRLYDGILRGRDLATAPYDGADPAMLRSESLRYGLRLVGDTFPNPEGVVAGGWKDIVCVTQGYCGRPWAASAAYNPEVDGLPYGYEATQVEPSGQPLIPDGTGQVWRVQTWVTPSATAPTWPASPSVGDTVTDAAGNVWSYVGKTATFKRCNAIEA